MRLASFLRWPWLVMGSVPPVDSTMISDQKTPVLICTDATLDTGIDSSLLPNRRDFTRATRWGLTTNLVGKKKFPFVQREAVNVSAGEESIAAREGVLINYSLTELLSFYTHSSAPFPHTQT